MTDLWNKPTDEVSVEPAPAKGAGKLLVDAHNGTVYGGTGHSTFHDAYKGKERALHTHPMLHLAGVQPVLARCVVRHDDATNQDVSTWYPVDLAQFPPGPLPGEWRLLHVVDGG